MRSIQFATGLLFWFSSVWWTFAEDPSPARNLFLREAISMTTDTGVLSLVPGTPVTRYGQTQNRVKVKTPDGTVIEVKESQLTTDRAEAGKLAQQEALAQAAIQAKIASTLEQQRIDEQKKAELVNQNGSRATPPANVDSAGPANEGLKRTPIQYEPVRANVVVHPPTFKAKKKKK